MVEIVLFDDDSRLLRPMNLTRPTHLLVYAFRPIVSHIKKFLGQPQSFILPPRFVDYYRELGDNVNPEEKDMSGNILFLNSSLRPEKDILQKISGISENTAVQSSGRLAALRTTSFSYDLLQSFSMLKSRGIELLEDTEGLLLNGPWEVISSLSKGLEGRGVIYGETARVEEQVYFDTTRGPVLIADGARVEAFSRIEGPALVGKNSVVHSARINAFSYIGENCRVGGEVEYSILCSYSNKSHFGYLGHSYVGEWVNIGAGSVTSDLKNTYGTVRVDMDGVRMDSRSLKLGAFLGDYSKIAINTSIYAGKKIGSGAHAYGLVDRDVAPFLSYSGREGELKELKLESVIETARRMKKRRNLELSRGEEELIKRSFYETQEERKITF